MEAITTKEEVYPLPEDQILFAIGYYYGQCEKVYLGACRACMLRPDEHDWDVCLKAIYQIAERLNLDVTTVPIGMEGRDQEIWVTQPGTILDFREVPPDTGSWHIRRAILCGILEDQIDPNYHLRE